jgi:hypothetical protein
MSCKHKVIKKTTKMNLSPDDIEEFRTEILDAGERLADLLVVEYPSEFGRQRLVWRNRHCEMFWLRGTVGDILGKQCLH